MSNNITASGTDTKELELGEIQERQEIKNFADDEGVSKAVTLFVFEHISNQETLLAPHFEDLDFFDYMYRCGRNSTQKDLISPVAVNEEAKSNVGSTMFFKEVTQGASKAYSFQHGRDRFFKYSTVGTPGVAFSYDDGAMQAKQLTSLAHWNLRADDFDNRVLMPLNMMVKKDGLCFIAANWTHEKGVKKTIIPGAAKEGGGYEDDTEIEEELILKNQMSYSVLNPKNIRLDPTIDTIEAQTCFSVLKTISIGDAVRMVEDGYWTEDAFRKLTADNRWDGEAGAEGSKATRENMGSKRMANANTSLFCQWQTWVMLPISDDGELDEKKYIPKRFVCDFVGNAIDSAVCMRIERNDTPQDKIPVGVVFDYPEVPGEFFRMSKGHVLKNSYAVETTLVNQMIDAGSLALNPPTIEVEKAIKSRPGKWWRGGRFVAKTLDSIKEFPIADRTQTAMGLLGWNSEDKDDAVDPEKTKGLGARATATEAHDVQQLSLAQSAANVKYVTSQLFNFVAATMWDYWDLYGMQEQVVQITDVDAPIQRIKPSEISGDFDIVVDVVDKIVGNIMEENKLSQDLALFTQNETLSAMADIPALLEEYFIVRYKRSFAKNQTDYDAVSTAQAENTQMRVAQTPVDPQKGQNDRVHLEQHEAERLRYRGLEGDEKWIKTIELLDIHIEKTKAQQGRGAQGGSQKNMDTVEPQGGAGTMPASADISGGMSPNVGQAAQVAAGQ